MTANQRFGPISRVPDRSALSFVGSPMSPAITFSSLHQERRDILGRKQAFTTNKVCGGVYRRTAHHVADDVPTLMDNGDNAAHKNLHFLLDGAAQGTLSISRNRRMRVHDAPASWNETETCGSAKKRGDHKKPREEGCGDGTCHITKRVHSHCGDSDARELHVS